ncbi:MAG: tetratricopeptide repeat protein [bacterium]
MLRLDQFATLNGELGKFANNPEREAYIEKFLLEKYGSGRGDLKVIQKKNKAKLVWTAVNVNSEAEVLHRNALGLAKDKNYDQAIGMWIKAIAHNPHDPDYYFHLGIAFFEVKNFHESIENLNKVIEICPIYPRAHLIVGTAYIKIRKYELAEKHLKESIILHPQHPLAYLNLGAVYSIMRRYEDGIEMFHKSLELSPREVRAHFGLGKIYSILGKSQKANDHYKQVIEIDSNRQLTTHAKKSLILIAPTETSQTRPEQRLPASRDVELAYQEGYRAYLFTDYEKAVKMYNEYLTAKPEDDFVYFSLGEAYLRSGQVAKAVSAFQQAVKLNSNKGLYHKELAIALSYLGERDSEVFSLIEKAKLLGKDDSVLSTLGGKILLKQDRVEEGIKMLEEAVGRDSNNLLAKYQLALAYAKRNEVNFAVGYLQEIIRSPISSPIKMEAEATLQRMQSRTPTN